MNRRLFSTGFVLSRKNFSEADRIITLYTKDYGKIALIAKSVRRTKSRKRGALEVFSHIKFSGYAGKGIPYLLEVEAINDFNIIRGDMRKVTVAYFFMEVISRLTREDEEHQKLYYLLKEYLLKLVTSNSLKKLRKEFTYSALVELGFWPEGKQLDDVDALLEEIIERKSSTIRVGKKLLT